VPPPDLRAVVRSAAFDLAGRGARVAIALSGGIDSIALLDALAALREELELALVALHAHHGISQNAGHWDAFCAEQCLRRGVDFESARLDLGARSGESLEAFARRARYAALEAMAARRGIGTLALGHHLDDQAETFLLQALRGASAHGLAAMPTLRKTEGGLRLWRPLLSLPRTAIVQYAESRRLEWVLDESNADTRIKRNLLRTRIFPEIEAGFPGYRTAFARASRRAAEAAELADALGRFDAAQCAFDEASSAALSLSRLRALGPLRARNAIRMHIAASGAAPADIERLDEFVRQALTAKGDRHPSLPLDPTRTLFATGGAIRVIAGALTAGFHACWDGERELALPHGVLHFTPTRGAGICASRLRAARCEIRARAGGERLRAAANRPSRTLKNLFQEAAVPAPLRRKWPLLVAGESLVAVPGVAIDVDWQCPLGADGWLVTWSAAEER
jgi:tRNA(Ile)-lysidine synthase